MSSAARTVTLPARVPSLTSPLLLPSPTMAAAPAVFAAKIACSLPETSATAWSPYRKMKRCSAASSSTAFMRGAASLGIISATCSWPLSPTSPAILSKPFASPAKSSPSAAVSFPPPSQMCISPPRSPTASVSAAKPKSPAAACPSGKSSSCLAAFAPFPKPLTPFKRPTSSLWALALFTPA